VYAWSIAPRGAFLTESGSRSLQHARVSLGALNAARRSVKCHDVTVQRRLRLGTVRSLLLFLLVPATLVWIPKGFFFINGGYEFPLLWCVLQLVMALCGPGVLRIGRSDERQIARVRYHDRPQHMEEASR
jgi:hypothetical protein